MPFQSVPNAAKAAINFSANGVPTANILNFQFPTNYTEPDLEDLASAVDLWVDTDYLPLIRDTVSYVNTVVTGLEAENDLQVTQDASAGAGLLTGGALPNNVTLCLSLRTGFTGRSARGRFYAQPYDATKLEAPNVVSDAFRNAWLTALTGLAADALGVGWEWGVLQRFSGGELLPFGIMRAITSILSVNDRVDSQRGRLPEE